ncbi:hypothetical protein SmJEL517_g04519 [Synchytrium microbalum]|uniref:Deacetylase sirtuin-type domain-containing protein n=1 Tax=Synchytrium microbalum TaxID=1806994 RepID=A0A507BZ32_9FUNG|nr:uncharacterized protein SmJEL517_g04519 [Synchytrium microbalum]TPX32368.1 hypothetical protein SmJEL517_g04519 [Synchytrium microbalum]
MSDQAAPRSEGSQYTKPTKAPVIDNSPNRNDEGVVTTVPTPPKVDQTKETPSEDPDMEALRQPFRWLLSTMGSNTPNPKAVLKDSTIESFATYIQNNNPSKIIVMTGAGISTSAGIPDFRTPGTGLYSNLQKYDLPFPEAIFYIQYFLDKPEPFYMLAKEMWPGNFKPTLSHYFIRLLAEKDVLLRNFTQNIDTLERVAGVNPELLVEAHGSFGSAHCAGTKKKSKCNTEIPVSVVKECVDREEIPRCPKPNCGGLVKPGIVFFGEGLPERFFKLAQTDFSQCDLLIVIGTSLQVQPFASLINQVPDHIPRLLVNMEEVGDQGSSALGFDFSHARQEYKRDAIFLGPADEGCRKLAELLGWVDELDTLIEKQNMVLEKEQARMSPKKKQRDGDNGSVAHDQLGENGVSAEKKVDVVDSTTHDQAVEENGVSKKVDVVDTITTHDQAVEENGVSPKKVVVDTIDKTDDTDDEEAELAAKLASINFSL